MNEDLTHSEFKKILKIITKDAIQNNEQYPLLTYESVIAKFKRSNDFILYKRTYRKKDVSRIQHFSNTTLIGEINRRAAGSNIGLSITTDYEISLKRNKEIKLKLYDNTYEVGPGKEFSTIQAAIDAVPEDLNEQHDHKIIITGGPYTEDIEINKPNISMFGGLVNGGVYCSAHNVSLTNMVINIPKPINGGYTTVKLPKTKTRKKIFPYILKMYKSMNPSKPSMNYRSR